MFLALFLLCAAGGREGRYGGVAEVRLQRLYHLCRGTSGLSPPVLVEQGTVQYSNTRPF